MQLVLSKNRVIAHGENFLAMGGVVINTETGAKYENATVAECDGCPSDIGEVGYEYLAGVFVPCAPYGKTEDGYIMVSCECGTPRKSLVLLSELLPAGSFLWFASETIPKGFLLCDGSALLKEYYPALYSVLGSTFGEETETEFYLPDMRAKFIRGAGVNDKYSATFGGTQEATFISPALGKEGATGADYKESTTSMWNTSSSSSNRAYGFAVRPYNVALTPIIKY